MKIYRHSSKGLSVFLAGALALSTGLALAQESTPMTPEIAAKREMVRKQQEQRITPEKRRAAAEALKAERLKLNQAREAARKGKHGLKDHGEQQQVPGN